MGDFDRESMMEMFTFEMNQLLEQLEQNIIQGENGYTMDQINEIFRIMHTIKGSAAMMLFNTISTSAHVIEDLFYYLREKNPKNADYEKITDLVLEAKDFIKDELTKIENGEKAEGDNTEINAKIEDFLKELKGGGGQAPVAGAPATASVNAKWGIPEPAAAAPAQSESGQNSYRARIRFESGSEMENVRSFTVVSNLKPVATNISHVPADVIPENTAEEIRENGFLVMFDSAKGYDDIYNHLEQTVYLAQLCLEQKDTSGRYIMKNGKIYCVKVNMEQAGQVGSDNEFKHATSIIQTLKSKLEFFVSNIDGLDEATGLNTIRTNGLQFELLSVLGYDDIMEKFNGLVSFRDLTVEERHVIRSSSEIDSSPQWLSSATATDAAQSGGNAAPAPAQQPVAQQSAPAPARPAPAAAQHAPAAPEKEENTVKKPSTSQAVISVNVSKLDQLLKLMGEIVIAEAMVTQNPELDGLQLENFQKEARQLRLILKDLQETIMSMRMVPLSTTFFKMNRIVRDMSRSLNKEIQLEIVGEETEVDKNIIEHISDPIMHIIRNSADHGIEMPEERRFLNKPEKGTILLEAKNSGSDILIIIKDDGAGLNRESILKKARTNGLLTKPENEYTDREIHQFIFMPGFSTNAVVTNYSGRGVGMDVVVKNLELVGGVVLVDSTPGEGSTFTLKIPLTLAIIDGMVVKMGKAKYIIPIMSIKDTFRPKLKDIFYDPSGNEMISVRGNVYNVVRLYKEFGMTSEITEVENGIMVMLENNDNFVCLFIDDLVAEQAIVVKAIPKYIKKAKGVSGCTLLGNGEVSLILDVAGFFDN